jgi:hypothetical protein
MYPLSLLKLQSLENQMAEYLNIEYRIGKDGKITERVIGATGSTCQETTSDIEEALGTVAKQELLPEYYQDKENLIEIETQKTSRL